MGQLRRGPGDRQAYRVGQQFGQRRMHPGPLPGQQVGVGGLAQQRVAERIALVAVGDQQLAGDRLPYRLVVFALIQAAGQPHQVVLHSATGHGRGVHDALALRRKPLQPGQQQVGQAGREVGPAGGGGEEFLGVVRVALGPADDRFQRRGFGQAWGGGAGFGRALCGEAGFGQTLRHRRQVLGHGLIAERPDLDRGHAGQPDQFGRHGPQRMAPVQVIGPVGGDDRYPFPVQHPAQKREQIPGGPVGPVHVLQDQQYRCRPGQLREHPEHRAEQLLLGHAGDLAASHLGRIPVREEQAENRPGGDRVHQRGHRLPRGGAVQGVGQGEIRNAVTKLRAPAGQHYEALPGCGRRHLGDQARLAHASIAADQSNDRLAGRGLVEQASETAELSSPAHEFAAGDLKHKSIIPGSWDNPGTTPEVVVRHPMKCRATRTTITVRAGF